MRTNHCKELLAAGKVPVGHMLLEFGTRNIARLCESAGLDFVVIDSEHTAFSIAHIADLLAWFRATTVTPFVRIPQVDYHFIARTLDQGAQGLMIPNVKNAAEAQAIICAAKYAPFGSARGDHGQCQHRFYPPRPR